MSASNSANGRYSPPMWRAWVIVPKFRKRSRPKASFTSLGGPQALTGRDVHRLAGHGGELQGGEARVQRALLQQFGVRAHRDLATAMHHHDAVRLQPGGEGGGGEE